MNYEFIIDILNKDNCSIIDSKFIRRQHSSESFLVSSRVHQILNIKMILKLAIANHQQIIARRGYRTFVRKCILASKHCQPDHIKSILNELPISTRHIFSNHWKRFSTLHFCNFQKKDDKAKSSQSTDESKSSKISLNDTVKSPLEVTTRAGKLIVSVVEDLKKESPKSIQYPTKNGTLLVHTSITKDDKLNDRIIFEQKTNESTQNQIKIENVPPKASTVGTKTKERRVDFSRSSLERNFITPSRAISDFLLKMSDLESLPKTKRRSPYEQEPPIIVYWRKDVEAKAIEVWGSRENLLRECLKREIERKQHQQNIFTVKRRLRDYRREMGQRTTVSIEQGLKGRSGRVVVTAIVINAANFVFKCFAWLYTGSHSMFAECIHSLADTTNQLILAYGIHKSTQNADPDHPYGYANMKYVTSLISGVGIFCVGTGLSFYHGMAGLLTPSSVEDFFWAFCVLGGSLMSEGATLVVAVNSIRDSAKLAKVSFREYVLRGEDPSVNVVLFEDTAAVVSVLLAAGCMGLSTYTGSSVPDAVGSLLVGCMLGGVASFIISTNVQALVGRSIPAEQLDKMNSELEKDIMIRAIHDVKGIDMGSSLVRYKAELDFDGRELTRFYLDKQDLNQLLEEVKSFSTIDELETFILKHGENIVDLMGGEIDRIEIKLRKKFPEIRHCDLEIL